jgi:hypothetical protein
MRFRWPFKKDKIFYAALPGNNMEPQLETYSATWKYVKGFLEGEIKKLQERNEKLTLDANATAAIRGQIKMARAVLELEKPGPDFSRSKTVAADIFGAER